MLNYLTTAQLRVVIRHAYWHLGSKELFTFRGKIKISKGNCLNPIPTGHGLNQPIYSYHVTQAGRNRDKSRSLFYIWNSKTVKLVTACRCSHCKLASDACRSSIRSTLKTIYKDRRNRGSGGKLTQNILAIIKAKHSPSKGLWLLLAPLDFQTLLWPYFLRQFPMDILIFPLKVNDFSEAKSR